MEDLLERKGPIQVFRAGDTVEGIVTNKTKNKIWFDVEGKAQGIVAGRELTDLAADLQPGDKVLASVVLPENDDGSVVLSLRRADREKIWENLQKASVSGEKVKVKIIEANKGGLMGEISGTRGFLPVSQLASENYPRVEGGDKKKILEKLLKFVGQYLEVKIIAVDKETNKLVFSERAVEEEAQQGIIANLKINQNVDAEVTGVVDFGLFVKFKESKSGKYLEGLIHISEVSWDRVENLKEKYIPGDQVKAKIIDISDGRVSLSIKRLLPDPWLQAVKKYKLDQVIEGEITRVTPFGAFVRLDKNIEGLVHISEISDEHVFDPREVLSVGEKKKFKIITIEPMEHRLGLSLKAIEENQPKKIEIKKKKIVKPKRTEKKESKKSKKVKK